MTPPTEAAMRAADPYIAQLEYGVWRVRGEFAGVEHLKIYDSKFAADEVVTFANALVARIIDAETGHRELVEAAQDAVTGWEEGEDVCGPIRRLQSVLSRLVARDV